MEAFTDHNTMDPYVKFGRGDAKDNILPIKSWDTLYPWHSLHPPIPKGIKQTERIK